MPPNITARVSSSEVWQLHCDMPTLREPLLAVADTHVSCLRQRAASLLASSLTMLSLLFLVAMTYSNDTVVLTALSASPSPSPSKLVLVTGYQAFGNMTTANPAEVVARSLDGVCDGEVCFEGRTLPVDRYGASSTALALERLPMDSHHPWYDAILHLGFESIAKGLMFEIAAANVLAVNKSGGWSANVPCNKSQANALQNETVYADIVDGGPCLLATTMPLDHLSLDANSSLGSPGELWSRDAGTYYCNEIYYRSLYAVRSRRISPAHLGPDERIAALPVAFMHLPPLERSDASTSAGMVKELAATIVGARAGTRR